MIRLTVEYAGNLPKKFNVVNERHRMQFALTEALLTGPVHVK